MHEKEYLEKRVFLDFVDQQIKNKYGVGYMLGEPFRGDIMRLPAADVVEVVRCKDCKYWSHETVGMIDHYECDVFCGAYGRGYMTGADDFCSYGERKAATQ